MGQEDGCRPFPDAENAFVEDAAGSDRMDCWLSEEDLWSGIDKLSPEIEAHLKTCNTCQVRAAEFRGSIATVRASGEPESPPLPESVGPYAIRRRLGEGGMGIVYEGEQRNPNRLVAVKVVRGGPHVEEYRLKLFQREVQTLARLRHPAIAAIYEAGRASQPFRRPVSPRARPCRIRSVRMLFAAGSVKGVWGLFMRASSGIQIGW